MTTTKTFSEMLHGDIKWMKQQEAVLRMRRMVLLDTELASHYEAQDMLLESLRGRRGFGRGMTLKVELIAATKAKAEINKRNPALSAEHRVGGAKAERSIALEMKRHSVMRLT